MANHRKAQKKAQKSLGKYLSTLIPIFYWSSFDVTIHIEEFTILRANIPIQRIVMAGLVPAIHALPDA